MITYQQAQEILGKYTKGEFLLQHAKTVSGVMRYFAKEYDPENEEKWAIVGLLHDIDYELYPNEHCIQGEFLLRENGVDEDIIYATMSHGYKVEQPSGVYVTKYEPTHFMEKILYATDELTGLIGAVAIMRPSKSVQDLELKSVKKKYKDKKFAASCSREVIERGADMLGWELDDLIAKTILAMRTIDA